MTKQQKSNLAKTAIALLDSDIDFNMHAFARDADGENISPYEVNKCGTSCCFAGYGPVVLHNGHCYINWGKYTIGTFGADSGGGDEEKSTIIWYFLFDDIWPDSKLEAAARALIVLEDRLDITNIDDFSGDERYAVGLTKKYLKKKLAKFICHRHR